MNGIEADCSTSHLKHFEFREASWQQHTLQIPGLSTQPGPSSEEKLLRRSDIKMSSRTGRRDCDSWGGQRVYLENYSSQSAVPALLLAANFKTKYKKNTEKQNAASVVALNCLLMTCQNLQNITITQLSEKQ